MFIQKGANMRPERMLFQYTTNDRVATAGCGDIRVEDRHPDGSTSAFSVDGDDGGCVPDPDPDPGPYSDYVDRF